jgi:DNA-directed RNA polymerase subunit M/transcription elongation factor TFIIS
METISKQLHSKISLIKKIIERARVTSEVFQREKFHRLLGSISSRTSELETKHILKTSHLILSNVELEDAKRDGIKSPTEISQKTKKIKEEYMKILSDENIINTLNIIAKDCSTLISLVKDKSDQNKLTSYLDKFYSTVSCDLINYVQTDDYSLCSNCQVQMISDFDTSELQCPKCGNIYQLVGTVYSETSNSSSDKVKNKSGIFNPNRHFQTWWCHILAKEPEEELGDPNDPQNQHGEKLIEQLRAIIRRDRKILRLLTVYDIRLMLKEIERTELNKNVPLILKKLTGIGPPMLSDEFGACVEKYFTKIIEIAEKQMKSTRRNRSYYPFYIYKIIDAIVPESNYEIRRVLYYIYVQSNSTIIQADREWRTITSYLDDIEFKVTDRFQYLKYAPH